MKVIANQKITAVTASNENANFPVENLLDTHPARVFKADSANNQVLLSFEIEPGTNGLGIFNTNAERAVANLSDPNAITWVGLTWTDDIEWPFTSIPTTTEVISVGTSKSIWVEFDSADVGMQLDVTLTNTTTYPYAGCAVAGEVQTFVDPQYGLTQIPVSYAIVKELSNGSFWGKKRKNVRSFSGTIQPERDSAFYEFMTIAQEADVVTPLAWKVTDLDSNEWAVYARFQQMPQGTHQYFRHSPIQFSLIEVL